MPPRVVFVNQRVEIANEGEGECAVLEERTHVYLALGTYRRTAREGKANLKGLVLTAYHYPTTISHLTYPVRGLSSSDVSFKFTPSPTTLFRFSALTFNGHRIHLDRDYARELEGYHGITIPCDVQAMFVRSQDIPEITERPVYYHHPEVQMKTFEYRALNPVIVNRELTFHGSMSGSNEIVLWVLDKAGVLVGMKGQVSL